MDWWKLLNSVAIVAYATLPIIAIHYSYKATQRCEEYLETLHRMTTKINETNEEFLKNNSVFHATGYSVLPSEDGKVLITFKEDIGDKDKAFVRQVELPAWMWSSAVIEATMKMNMESLEKIEKNENH